MEIKTILEKVFGYKTFRKGQQEIIENILNKNNTLGLMPTGGGKSLCYQIPAIASEGTTIVISPLISLMKDQVKELNDTGIGVTTINSSMNNREVEEELNRIRSGEIKLIYVSPERLLAESFVELANGLTIPLIVVDEAHCMSQWGHDFRKSYLNIGTFIGKLRKKPVIGAFTATATEKVIMDIKNGFEISGESVFKENIDRENLYISVIKEAKKNDYVLEYLKTNRDKSGIIYVGSRKKADALYDMIKDRGYKVGIYHAGLSDSVRNEQQEKFKNEELDIMVATNAFGMGINKTDIRFILHYNMPKDLESYYQEIGRAGRDGEKAECILLYSASDIILQKYLINQNVQESDPETVKEKEKKLNEIVSYANSESCYRSNILNYFGEKGIKENCGNCSNCINFAETDITEEAYKIISAVGRSKERFGINVITEILAGSNTEKIRNNKLNELSTYGLMKNIKKTAIKSYVNTLISQGYLKEEDSVFMVLKLTEKAWELIKNKELRVKKKEVLRASVDAEPDKDLFEFLRELRRDMAREEKIPPYVICSDNSLKEISLNPPGVNDDFLKINGFGEVKIKKYGERFIKEINRFLRNSSKSSESSKEKSYEISCNMFLEGKDLGFISTERKLSPVTVESHLFEGYKNGMNIDLDIFINKENEELILKAIREKKSAKLKEIKEALPEYVAYTEIKAVYAKHKLY